MMNKTVERIMEKQDVTVKELFELINIYRCTYLCLSNGKESELSMNVNELQERKDAFVFCQECTSCLNSGYVLPKDEIISAKGKWNKEANALFVNCELKNSKSLKLIILHPFENIKETETKGFYETDVYELKEFLEEVMKLEEWYCVSVKFEDPYGFILKMRNPVRTYINELSDDWKLHISDDMNEFETPVIDDSCNKFFKKKSDTHVEFLIKPYGQPFMDIKMLFFKKREE